MIRQQAFEGKEKMLKGALHCHTTRSDGQIAPAELMEIYKRNHYDFMALTDHRIYNFTNYAPETGLLIIPGMEFDNAVYTDVGYRCYHTVCIGPAKEDGNGFLQDEIFQSGEAKSQEEYQPFLDDFHAKKNLTIYCHPQWSSTPARYFEKQKGNIAMEIWNTVSAIGYDMDNDAAYWDELLGQGIRIYGVAGDDVHRSEHCCKGWVMAKAERNINSILKALEAGEFYSSCGPEIYDFYIKDDKVVVDCSAVSKIRLHSDCHPTRIEYSEDGSMTHAEFDLHWKGGYQYVRATVIDKDGKHAWTNPIFIEE